MKSEGSEPSVRAEGVEVSFGPVSVLRGVTLEARPGETLCILGGSGGGKSTLLKVLIGALRPSSGSVSLDSQDISRSSDRELDPVRKKIGVMFQGGALLNSLTIAENVALPLRYHTALDADTIETMVKIKLQQVDLLHAADRRPSEISGGMQKRAAVARALALDPKILFYDEPSAGLDPIATSQIDQLINRLRDTMGITSIVVTHVMESVQRIADRIVLLHQGAVLVDGDVQTLLQCSDPRVQQFVRGDIEGYSQGAVGLQSYYKDLLA